MPRAFAGVSGTKRLALANHKTKNKRFLIEPEKIIAQTRGKVKRFGGGFERFFKKNFRRRICPVEIDNQTRNKQKIVSAIKNAKLNAENIARYFPAFSG